MYKKVPAETCHHNNLPNLFACLFLQILSILRFADSLKDFNKHLLL